MIPVELAPEVVTSLRQMRDRDEQPPRCYGGVTPYSTYLRGVIIDGDAGIILAGRDDSALIIEG